MITATNANTMKEKNRRLIIDIIRKNSVSRTGISKDISLTKAAISIIVDDLLKSNVVFESKSEEAGVGRHPLMLNINPDFMYAIGINITRSYVELGIVDITGKIIVQSQIDVYPKKDAIKNIIAEVKAIQNRVFISDEKIYAIGVTAPGPVDSLNATILNPPGFEEWHYENIGLRLKTALNKHICLENISTGLALREKYYGIAKDFDDFLLLTVGDGIGSEIMTSGKLLKSAPEFGHMSISYNGIKCECGNTGCIEKYASIPAILKGTPYKSWKEVIDAEDRKIIEKEADFLSFGIINAVNLFNTERVILGGEINYNSEKLISAVKEKIFDKTITKKMPKVYSTNTSNDVVCAATVAFNDFFNGDIK